MDPQSTAKTGASALLLALGQLVQRLRKEERLSRQALADRCGVSVRFLAQLEAGHNVSVETLSQVAGALARRPSQLLAQAEETAAPGPPDGRTIALIGLRGAGKSTLGRLLAARLGRVFVELDERIEEAAGLSLGEIFALHGEAYYRRLEQLVLEPLLLTPPSQGQVLATGGGLVTDPIAYDLLRRHARTVWLRARPEEHWERVIAQGDRRPMSMAGEKDGNDPRAQLQALLVAREPLYEKAALTLHTSDLDIHAALETLVRLLV